MRVDLPELISEGQNELEIAEPPPSKEAYEGLRGLSRQLARLINSPAILVYRMMVPVSLAAWVWLVFAARNAGQLQGDVLVGLGVDGYAATITRPLSSTLSLNYQSITMIFIIWMIMAVAMMLPSAMPMLRTYADIANLAGKKREKSVSLLVLAAGYLTIWLMFSIIATAFQLVLIKAGQANSHAAPVSGVIGGLILMLAGLYQFSKLKNACLVKCRNPFTIIFGRWSTRPADIYRLGLQQGVFCLGCCWALMLVMLSVGTMNLMWMALLTLFTLIEKTVRGLAISRAAGIVLLAWGLYLMLNSVSMTFL